MNLNHMLNFIQIVEWGNISKAAAFLNIAQPALSRQVRALEETLETKLLQRRSWGVEPTEDGKTLLEYALRIQKEYRSAQAAMQANRDDPVGTAFIGVVTAYSVALVPLLLERMHSRYPRIKIHIVEAFSGTIYEWLVSGRLDLAVLYHSKEHSSATVMPFIDEDMFVLGTAEAIGGRSIIPLEELADRKLVVPWRPHLHRLTLESAFMAAGIPFVPKVEIDSMPGMIELAHRGDGLTILPPSTVARELASGRLFGAPMQPGIRLTTVLGQTPNRQPTRAVRILINTLRTLAEDLAPETGWNVTKTL